MVCFCCGFRFVNFGRIAMTLARSLSLTHSLSLTLSNVGLRDECWRQTGRKVREISRQLSVKQTALVLVARVEYKNQNQNHILIGISKGYKRFHRVYSAWCVFNSVEILSANFVLISLPHSNLSFVHSIHSKIQINFPSHTFSNQWQIRKILDRWIPTR